MSAEADLEKYDARTQVIEARGSCSFNGATDDVRSGLVSALNRADSFFAMYSTVKQETQAVLNELLNSSGTNPQTEDIISTVTDMVSVLVAAYSDSGSIQDAQQDIAGDLFYEWAVQSVTHGMGCCTQRWS